MCDFAYAAYLMNIDLSNQPELQIAGIKETEGGWLIKITATAGESNIDLGNINGTIKVKAAATLAELATAEADAYSIEVAGDSSVITKVTNDNNNFMRAMVTK